MEVRLPDGDRNHDRRLRLPVLAVQEIALAVAAPISFPPGTPSLDAFALSDSSIYVFTECVFTGFPCFLNVCSISVAYMHKTFFLPLTLKVEHDVMCFLKEYLMAIKISAERHQKNHSRNARPGGQQ
jgi:hypothetical protein